MPKAPGDATRTPRHRRRVAALFATMAAIAANTGVAAAQSLDRQVSSIVGRARLAESHIGVSIIDADTGAVLAQLNAGEPMIPASNMKLLTTGTALLVLGPDFEFRTRIIRSGDMLVIEGAGDPAFADPVLLARMNKGVGDFVSQLVTAVTRASTDANGVVETWVREVVVDDRVFDREYIHPTWPRNQLHQWYCCEVGGLNFHANVLNIYASPAERGGDAPPPRSEPSAPWIELRNEIRTIREGTTTIGALREGDSTRFIVRGSIRAPLEQPIQVTTHESSLIFGRMLADGVAAAGLSQTGRTPTVRFVTETEAWDESGRVLAVVRTPLDTVLQRSNVDSHNLYAEALLKRVAYAVTRQPGSWSQGSAVMRMQVRETIGPDAAAGLTVADGSGMSRENRVSADLLARWLVALNKTPRVSEAFVGSLPLAGMEGTLQRRFRRTALDNEVRAKSGFINGVRTLSGYVTHRQTGRRIAFSILVNNTPPSISGARVREFHEEIVEALDKWLSDQAAAELAREAVGG